MNSRSLLSISAAFALLPLLIGSFIFWIWFCYPVSDLERFGMLTVYISVPVCIAHLSLMLLLKRNNRDKLIRRKLSRNILLVLLNIPFCCFYIGFADHLLDFQRIKIVNYTMSEITDVHVFGTGRDYFISRLYQGENRTVWVYILHEGAIRINYKRDNFRKTECINGYVTPGLHYERPTYMIK